MLRDGVLIRTSSDGTVIAQFPLHEITDIRVEKRVEYVIPAVIIIVSVPLSIVCNVYIPYAWNWLGTIVCLGAAALALFGIVTPQIVITTKHGKVGYGLIETQNEGEGFAIAIKLLASAQSPVGSWQATDGSAAIKMVFEGGPLEGLYKQLVESGGETVREFGSWLVSIDAINLLIMATDVPEHPRFGVDTRYAIEYIDRDTIRLDGPDRPSLLLKRSAEDIEIDFDADSTVEAEENDVP